MKRIVKRPPARAYASMAEMCYKHYQISLREKKMVDASKWLMKAHAYRESAGQFGHEEEMQSEYNLTQAGK